MDTTMLCHDVKDSPHAAATEREWAATSLWRGDAYTGEVERQEVRGAVRKADNLPRYHPLLQSKYLEHSRVERS